MTVSAFKDHDKSNKNRNFVWIEQRGKKTMKKMDAASNKVLRTATQGQD